MKISPPSPLEPHDWFTGRKAQADLFKSRLARFRRLLDAEETVEHQQNRNVVVFHGVGGVGKTALSVRLERWVEGSLPLVNGWGPPPATKVHATARIDFHDSNGSFDFLDLLLTLRRSLHSVRHSWGSFDLALAAYWAARFPGSPLPTNKGQPNLQATIADTIGEFVSSILELSGVPVSFPSSLTPRGLLWIANKLQEKRELHHQLNLLDGFGDFLLACASMPSPNNPRSDIASKLAEHLAWELSKVSPAPLLVVFVDATERLLLDSRRAAEHDLNRLIGSLPNVLFVLTGRDSLDWHRTDRAELPCFGAARWPDLDPSVFGANSCQIRLSNLSESDSVAVLEAARRDEGLPISDEVLREIAVVSAGHPQYLRLVCDVARGLRESGIDVFTIGDLAASLEALVVTVFEDISNEEQQFIRAACLFHAFETEFTAKVANVGMAVAARAVTRPLIDPTDDEGVFRVHDEIRNAIRGAAARRLAGWTTSDWESAASRALVEARSRFDIAISRGDYLGARQAIGMAVLLVCEHRVLPSPTQNTHYGDWLSRAIVFAPSIAGLVPFIPATSSTPYGSLCLDFILSRASGLDLKERLMLLRRVFYSDHPLALPAGRHLAYALRNHSMWDESLGVINELIEKQDSDLHVRQLAATLCVARRFKQALNAVHKSGVTDTVTGQVEFAHGKPKRYFEEGSAKVARLRSQGRVREELEHRAIFMMRRAFFTGVSAGDLEALKDEAEAAGHSEALRTALIAETLVIHMNPMASRLQFDRIRRMSSGVIDHRLAMGECVDALRKGDNSRLDYLSRKVDGRGEPRSGSWVLVEHLFTFAGRTVAAMDTEWLEPEQTVSQRWTEHIRLFLRRTEGVNSV